MFSTEIASSAPIVTPWHEVEVMLPRPTGVTLSGSRLLLDVTIPDL